LRRVLIISALQVFPVRSGGQMRTAGIARLLARSGFDVTVHSFTGRKPDLRSRRPSQFHAVEANLREYVDTNRLRLLISLVCYRLNIPPFWIYLERSVKRHRALASSIAESNVVIWDFPYLHQDADQVNGRVCILNTHNYETKLWSGAGWFNRILKYFVNRIERRAVSSSSTILVCSEADKKALQGLGGSAEYLVVSNGVDPNRFVNCKQDREPIRARSGFNDSKVILYSASAYAPNVAGLNFLREIAQKFAPELRQRKIRFLVVGSVSREANNDEFVHCTGPVDKVEPYFGAADFAINPLFEGSGTSLKLAEYIIAGLPVLTTVVGARGYELDHGRDAWFFNSDADVLRMLDEMMSAPDYRQICERSGKRMRQFWT